MLLPSARANITAGVNTAETVRMLTNKSKNIIADAQSCFALAMAKLELDLQSSYLTALSGGADSSGLGTFNSALRECRR